MCTTLIKDRLNIASQFKNRHEGEGLEHYEHFKKRSFSIIRVSPSVRMLIFNFEILIHISTRYDVISKASL